MKDYLKLMSERILENKSELAHFVTDEQNRRYPNQLLPISNELLPLRVELVTLYGESLALSESDRKQRLEEWGRETGRKCAMMGTTLDSMLNEVPHYRHFIGNVIKEEAVKVNLSLEELYDVISVFDQTVNEVVYYFSLPFVEFHNEQLQTSKDALLELSVPVVPLAEGVAVLPVIGTIDTYRARLIMEQALEHSVSLQLNHFVLDLSGVPIIDTFVAQKLFQIIDALTLIGVNAKISGITPEIAQTIVNLGIDFTGVRTYSTLKQALSAIGFTHKYKE
ncbi:STAS domain-containing protein [Metabacillus iocasae]|uniref:RsbT co-antagonist protein RsbR n=1 Tax=Priestia iocasae TaxID=2291674 RepID=A0ABS2QXI2_9BACI|nr:STAS domain-containing protein [Metabacillus iocasae]MBM7703662.1 rsbT co-antagonist protein RsbR [Metabacillus iocasae]